MMTKEDWALAQQQTMSGIGECKLLVDGYHISLYLEPQNSYKNIITILIDNKYCYKWCVNDCDIRRRFCRPVTKSIIKTQKQRERLADLPKKAQKEMREQMKYVVYRPYWNSFSSLKWHLLKNNISIELLQEVKT